MRRLKGANGVWLEIEKDKVHGEVTDTFSDEKGEVGVHTGDRVECQNI